MFLPAVVSWWSVKDKKKSCFHVHINVLLLDSVSITKCCIELWHTLIPAYMLLCLRNTNSSSGVQVMLEMVPETSQTCPNLDFFELFPGLLLLGGSAVSLHMVRTFEATPEGTQKIVLLKKKIKNRCFISSLDLACRRSNLELSAPTLAALNHEEFVWNTATKAVVHLPTCVPANLPRSLKTPTFAQDREFKLNITA